jgi:hypothetical protein
MVISLEIEVRFFYKNTDRKPMSTLDVFVRAASKSPAAGQSWLNQLVALQEDDLARVVDLVPETLITAASAEFAKNMLLLGRKRLLDQSRV